MKILQFVPYFLPYPGGQERYVYNLSKHLVKMGHEVHVITSNFPKSREFEEIDGITVERYKPIARPLRNPLVPKFFQVPKRFPEFDVIHIHNEHSFPAMIAAYARRSEEFPLILTNHGKLIFGSYPADSIERLYMKHVGRNVFRASDAIVVNSKSDKNLVSRVSPESEQKIHVIPNSIDPESLLEKLERSQDIKIEGVSTDFVILYVGVLIRRKGIEWLIKALKNVKKNTNKKIKCVLVGEGPDRSYFEALVKRYGLSDVVLFTGRVSDEELVWWYTHSDVFVLPSLSEGLPTTILEAMYFNLPVIATDIPGIRDHFKESAILVPPKDEKDLSNAILMLIKNENLTKQLSKAGKKLVKDRYTWSKVAGEYEKVYKQIVHRGGIQR